MNSDISEQNFEEKQVEEKFDAKSFLKTVPNLPGCYRMYNQKNEVIYVGKAKDLKKRLSSYFVKEQNAKTSALVSHIQNIEFTVTFSETEALILENELIKKYQPHYNILLRDDKSYPYILLTTEHQHPGIYFHRGPQRKKGEYFGPFPDSTAVKDSLRLLQNIFPIRQCEDTVYSHRSRPCLLAQIGKCLAPCVAMTPDKEQIYHEQVELIKLFLQGRSQELLNTIVNKMEEHAQKMEFEQAGTLRDQLVTLRKVQESNSIICDIEHPVDIIGFAISEGIACIYILFIRNGRILGSRSFFPKLAKDQQSNKEIVLSFICQFYLNENHANLIPDEVVVDLNFNSLSDDNHAKEQGATASIFKDSAREQETNFPSNDENESADQHSKLVRKIEPTPDLKQGKELYKEQVLSKANKQLQGQDSILDETLQEHDNPMPSSEDYPFIEEVEDEFSLLDADIKDPNPTSAREDGHFVNAKELKAKEREYRAVKLEPKAESTDDWAEAKDFIKEIKSNEAKRMEELEREQEQAYEANLETGYDWEQAPNQAQSLDSDELPDYEMKDLKVLEIAIKERFNKRLRFLKGSRGPRKKFMQLAMANAKVALDSKLSSVATAEHRIIELERLLVLSNINRMECYDISHTMGELTVASCVVFNRLGPESSRYRRYNIEGITPGDDFAAMHQVLERRFRDPDNSECPQLVFIDGGPGQLKQAEEVLTEKFAKCSTPMPNIVAVAKGEGRKEGLETLIKAFSHERINLSLNSPALQLVLHIRDEAHRFAITGHRSRIAKERRTSKLESLPGIGPKRRQALLKHLGGIKEVLNASVSELHKVPGISKNMAQSIYDNLHS